MLAEPRRLLRTMFDTAVGAASPELRVPAYLPPSPKGRTVVIGAGKASAAMAKAVEARWPGPLTGLVVPRYGHAVPCERIEIVEASHPVPDENGHRAALHMLEMVRGVGPDDLVLTLISGGGSALLSLLAPGLTLADKQAVNAALLRSGAPIGEMNVTRKHLPAIKGGRLAVVAHSARLVTLVISDVPGDDPAVIASGPTVSDASTFAEARAVLGKYSITEPDPRSTTWPAPRTRPRSRAIPGWPTPAPPWSRRRSFRLRRRPTWPGGRGSPRSSWATRSKEKRGRSAGSWPGLPAKRRCVASPPRRPPAAIPDAICACVRQVTGLLPAAAVVTYTNSGSSSLRASRERPEAPIRASNWARVVEVNRRAVAASMRSGQPGRPPGAGGGWAAATFRATGRASRPQPPRFSCASASAWSATAAATQSAGAASGSRKAVPAVADSRAF